MKRLVLFVLSITPLLFGLRQTPLRAQSAEPAVSRRTVPLTGGVWPGDFNGDGITDLASTSSTPAVGFKPIVVAIGKGDGTFNAPMSSGTTGGVLATGDFNKDGKLDLVVSVDTDDAPLRLLSGNGDGTFGAPVRIGGAVVASLTFAAVADFDGDGNSDVAVGYIGESDDSGVLIYQGLGDGTFTEVIARLNTGDNSGPYGGVVADLNRDGRPDVVVANHFAKSLSIFINQGSFVFTASDRQMAWPSNDVAAADVNGDGKVDLMVAEAFSADGDVSYENGTVVVYFGNGDGTIAEFGRFNATARGAWRVVTGDFNRDGVLDIATANRSAIAIDDCGPRYKTWDSVSVLTGNGDGTFASGSNEYSLTSQTNLDDARYRNNVWSLAAVDVNGDRAADLVVSNGVVFVNNKPDPNWAPTVTAGPDRLFSGSHTVTLRAIADDVDQDMLYYAWSSDANISIPNVPNPCITVPRDGTFTFTVTVTDMHGHYASATIHYSFSGDGGELFVYPSVTVTAPTGGEIVETGVPYTIRWTATAGTYPISRFNLRFSSGGATVSDIAGCTNLPPSATSCQWNSPGPPTETAYVQIETISTSGPSLTTGTGRFSIRGTSNQSLPNGWSHGDVGNVGAAGDASFDGYQYDGEVYTVSGSGADIWNTADEFHFAWKSMTGNFEINARVGSVDAVNAWTKAGLMVRASATDPSSPHVSLFVTPGKGIAFQRRLGQGGTSYNLSGPAYSAPVYLRLVRSGNDFYSFYRKNPTDPWTGLGLQTMAGLSSTVDVGLAVTSHADGKLATAKFAGVRLAALPSWSSTSIGGATGAATNHAATSYFMTGSGADIWGTSDGLEYLWVPLNGNGTITARVLSVQNTNAWAKAGVMVRESLTPNAKQVDAIVTPGKGFAMQYRDTTGGISASAGQVSGAAPAWVRLQRGAGGSIGLFTAWYSTDGITWRVLGTVNLSMTNDVYVGLAVTSHNASTEAAAVFDDVRIDR